MTDPLDDLKRAFDRATPEPDAERRRENLALAQELLSRNQGSEAERRRTDDRPNTWAGIQHGVRHMLNAMAPRPVLAALCVLAAVGLGALLMMVTRTPAPPVVVADTGAAPEPLAAPPSVPEEGEEESETDARAAESSDDADPLDQAEASAGTEREETSSSTTRSEVSLATDRAASASEEVAVSTVERVATVMAEPPVTVVAETPVTVTAQVPLVDKFSVAAGGPPEVPEVVPPAEATRPAEPAVVAESVVVAESLARATVSARTARSAAEPPVPAGVGPVPDVTIARPTNTEAFANEDASPLKIASEEPVSTFSIDVDTASYSVLRSSLTNGYLPSPESVRIEELINYFPYAYPPPGERGAPFRPTVTVSETPWNADTLLMQIGIQGRQAATDDRPPLNLVFLIDTSGSMDQPNKLPLLLQSFRLLLGQLRPVDEVGIVTYAGSVNRVLDATPATERSTILSALDRLRAGGSTAGAAGIQLAYGTAAGMVAEDEVTRVILATDGDFNVGISDPEQLEDFIARQRDSGIYLSVLGFGRGNLDDATMQALAQNGNGQAAYIDTLSEARKVLVDQLTGTLFPIADDVKIQVEFNPAAVAEYRLIGYETRALRREDFNNDRVDAGEIGAGHAVTAIYEVTPVGSPAVLHDALRYADRSAEPPVAAGRPGRSEELAFLRLRYKEPGENASRLIELPIGRDAGGAGSDQSFAAAIAGFGQLLRGGVYTGGWTFTDAIALAEANTGSDRFGYRREAVTLMRLAESLAE